MQIRSDALAGALERRLPALIWVHGDEPLLAMEAGDVARAKMRAAGFDEREIINVDRYFKAEDLLAHTQAMSLFASRRVIELRTTGKPGKELGQALAEAVPTLDDDTRLLVSGPRLDRATTDSAWFAKVEQRALVVSLHPPARDQLAQWIGNRLARQKQRASVDTLEFLAERVEGNLLAAHQEIQKLGLLFAQGELPDDGVRQAVLNVARYDAFDAVGAMLAGDVARVLRSLDGLRAEGEAEPLVLWALSDALRNLARLAQGRDAGRAPAQMMGELRIYNPRDRAYTAALSRLNSRTLRAALQEAARIDRIIKGLVRDDAWTAMTALAAGIAGAPVLLSLAH